MLLTINLMNNLSFGNPPNYRRLKELGKEGVKCLIIESLYADYDIETPSEEDVKKEMLDIFSKLDITNKTIITSTFSSHIVRLRTLVDTGQKLEERYVCSEGVLIHIQTLHVN